MIDEKLVLYGDSNWASPYVFSAFVALKVKNLPFEMRLLHLAKKESFAPDYRAASLTGRVPALVHGEFWLSESSAIDEYLEERFGPPTYTRLYPEAIRERARARQIQAWLRSDLGPLREERSTEVIFYGRKVSPLSAAGAAAAERLLAAVEKLLPSGASSLFETFSIVDADVALMLQRLMSAQDPVPERLRAYAEAVWRRPSVREFVEHPRGAYEEP
jgi:glutathione S-transferase